MQNKIPTWNQAAHLELVTWMIKPPVLTAVSTPWLPPESRISLLLGRTDAKLPV